MGLGVVAIADPPTAIRLKVPFSDGLGGGKFKVISSLLQRLIRFYYHCEIPYSIDLTDVYLNHKGFGIVINPKTVIGKGTNIQHGVTLGINNGGTPIIGKNVYIGAKATIIGPVKIGDGAKIGASALVITDIPAGCTAVGVPAKVVKGPDENQS